MCSYCGCEAQPSVAALMKDHGVIADLCYEINRALLAGDADRVRPMVEELAARFGAHSLAEESGLFAELRAAGEATAELDRLVDDHVHLRERLAERAPTRGPEQLRATLADLARHAETEDSDLFPFALQALPASAWARINRAVAATDTAERN